MKKYFLFLAAAVCGLFSSCSDDDDDSVAVGITSVSVTPEGSAVSYNCTVNLGVIENTNDSIGWDVAYEALQNAHIKVTTTIGSVAYYGDAVVSESGFVADVTAPITLQARGADGVTVVTYTLNVVQAKSAGNVDMAKKASTFNGFPKNLLDYDIAYFKNKFYATVTSLSDDSLTENYDLFTSENGVNWTKVEYTTNTNGVVLPEGQTEYVVGGEGASLVVFNDRLYVLGGARTKGADKFGNPAEISDGWFGPTPSIDHWRAFSTADGETFDCDTVGISLFANGQMIPTNRISMMLAQQGADPVAFNGKLYLFGGYRMAYGMTQPGGSSYVTENGKDWTMYVALADNGLQTQRIVDAARFVFKGKMWCVGGLTNFISASNLTNSIYSTEDGEAWKFEGNVPDSIMGNIFGWKAVVTDDVVYLVGGQRVPAEDGVAPEFALQMFRSTDCINWEVVEMPANYDTPRRNARLVAVDNQAWIFGGINTLATGNYAYPTELDTWTTDTWVKIMK